MLNKISKDSVVHNIEFILINFQLVNFLKTDL